MNGGAAARWNSRNGAKLIRINVGRGGNYRPATRKFIINLNIV